MSGRAVGCPSDELPVERSALATRAGDLDRPSCANRGIESMLVTATLELRQHVMDHGGSLFVHCQRRGVPFLLATTKEPRSLELSFSIRSWELTGSFVSDA